jgi:hypothetical protein
MTAFILTAVLSISAAESRVEPTLEEKVAAARGKAIEFLKKQQDKRGTWEETTLALIADMEGGATALVALALLEAGVPANDPAVVKAVDYLVRLEPKKTYVVSLQTQVLCRVDGKKHQALIQKSVDWLQEKAVKTGKMLAGWSYPASNLADGSNTHFAVMALHAASEAGAKVDAKVWEQIRGLYQRSQKEGGWGYYSDRKAGGEAISANMTACGLLGLSIADKHDKNAKGSDPAFEKGMPVLLKLRSGGKSEAYGRFAIAELGRVLGTTEFKAGKMGVAWYREGAERLLQLQKADGSFDGKPGLDANPILSTAFGLYFLGPPAKK